MRNHPARWFTLFAALLALSFLANPRPAVADDDDDPPARAARLSYTGGSVSFEPGGTDDWVDAIVNRPMTTGDKLWTDRDGRAEIRIDSYALRLGPQTGFSFLNLDDSTVQVRLTEGSLNIRVRRMDDNQTLEIDTPNLAFNVLRPGSYRVDVNENGDATVVSIRDGQGEVTGGGSAYPIHAGQSATFSGTDDLYADVQGDANDDDFDRWCGDRDRRWDRSTSPRYVSDDVVGYEDLDEYGGWRSVPEYGTIWFPHTTVVGWAPYRYGHWVWISPWGWTWVDDAPWGFAPFHYGRWVVVRGVWGWVPSPPRPRVVTAAYVRPVYAPALVAWVGGSRWGVGVSVGSVGAGVAWFPLGPRDVYCPSYHVSPRYVERVNVSNTVIINRTQVTNVYNNVYVNKTVNVTNVTYQNQRASNAVTATSRASFTSAQPVGRNMVRVDQREVQAAPIAAQMPTVAPQQRSFTGGAAQARVRPPANALARPVVAKTAPPPAPIPVAKQMQQVQANGGRPLATSQIRQVQETSGPRPNVKVAAPAKQATLPARGQGMNNRPGQPGQPPVQTQQNQQNNGRPATTNQPNQQTAQPNRPPNANNPNQGNANQDNPAQNNANRGNPNRPANANPNSPNPANPNQGNANQDNPAQNNANKGNPNRPANANPNSPNPANPNQGNANQDNPAQNNANKGNPNRPANANPNSPNPANPNQGNANRGNANQDNVNPNANRPGNNRATNDRPPASRPAVDPQTDQRQQQQIEKLRQQQDQERQKVEQKQVQQQQKLEQQRANDQRQQQIQKQQQQQLEQLERKHDQQQQKLQQNQQKEVQKEQQKPQQQQKAKPPKNDNKDNKDNKDRPPSR